MDARRYIRELEEKDKVMTVSELTGRGVFECKKALRHSGWDVDKAVDWLSEHSLVELTRMRKEGRNNEELEIVREKIQNHCRVVKTDEDLEWNRAIDLCINIVNAHIKCINKEESSSTEIEKRKGV